MAVIWGDYRGNMISRLHKISYTLQLVAAGFLSEWTYWNAQNAPLTDEQLAALDHHAFIKLYVHFEFAHTPPDQTPRLEAKKTRPVRKKVTKARV